jgi:hypothetical protein
MHYLRLSSRNTLICPSSMLFMAVLCSVATRVVFVDMRKKPGPLFQIQVVVHPAIHSEPQFLHLAQATNNRQRSFSSCVPDSLPKQMNRLTVDGTEEVGDSYLVVGRQGGTCGRFATMAIDNLSTVSENLLLAKKKIASTQLRRWEQLDRK